MSQLETLLKSVSVTHPECVEISRRFIQLQQQPIATKPLVKCAIRYEDVARHVAQHVAQHVVSLKALLGRGRVGG